VCVTQLSSGTVAARTKLRYEAGCAAILPDGRLAGCIARGNAALTVAPAAAADVLKAHGAATFAGATATKMSLVVGEPPPPPQDAVVHGNQK
jgi:hypothetical protein